MRTFIRAATAIALLSGLMAGSPSFANEKNWTPPKDKIYAQKLSDDLMSGHPELLSVTFHGVPPGAAPKTYTMYAGSYPDRIGNADDPDDVDVITKGITIVDPRWHRVKDTKKKFVVQEPLRDASGQNIGLLVLAFKNDTPPANPEEKYYADALAIRDALKSKIQSYEMLFKPVN